MYQPPAVRCAARRLATCQSYAHTEPVPTAFVRFRDTLGVPCTNSHTINGDDHTRKYTACQEVALRTKDFLQGRHCYTPSQSWQGSKRTKMA